jgi:hypothetical protein
MIKSGLTYLTVIVGVFYGFVYSAVTGGQWIPLFEDVINGLNYKKEV